MPDKKKTSKKKPSGKVICASDNITENTKSTNYVFEEYTDMFTMRQRPASLEYIEKIAAQLVDWANNCEEAYKLTQFYRLRGIGSSDMKRWEERCPALKKAHTFALSALGDRREIGAMKKKLDAGIVATTMPHYDQDWKDMAEWRSKLTQKEEANKNGTQVVVIERFPNSELVPEKAKEEDE